MTAEVRPWQLAPSSPHDARRRELFSLAAPVFRVHGYRGSTVKALAHACHLTPAGLYHYFDSKADLATWLVRQPHLDWQLVYVDPTVDPVRQLGSFVDLAIGELPDFLLALDLAEELEVPGVAMKRRALFREGENVLGRYLAAVRPGLTPDAARDLAALILSLLVGSHEIAGDQGSDPAAVRDHVVRVLRAELVPVAVDSARFDRELAAR